MRIHDGYNVAVDERCYPKEIKTPNTCIMDMLSTASDMLEQSPEISSSTATTTTDLPVYGYPGLVFWSIHCSALTSISISVCFSSGIIINLFFFPMKNPFKRPIGERLVIYLALCDLALGISHIMDHAAMIQHRNHPPDEDCAAYGFLLGEFVFAQALVISFTGANAYLLVVKERKIALGVYDWKLLLFVFGVPLAIFAPYAALGHTGPSGGWCFIDLRDATGPYISWAMSTLHMLTSLFSASCYLFVWKKLRSMTSAQTYDKKAKYKGTARIMMLFVAVYLVQWWPMVVYGFWAIAEQPHWSITLATVIIVNLGGCFNFFVYTWMRRKLAPTEAATQNEATVFKRSVVKPPKPLKE